MVMHLPILEHAMTMAKEGLDTRSFGRGIDMGCGTRLRNTQQMATDRLGVGNTQIIGVDWLCLEEMGGGTSSTIGKQMLVGDIGDMATCIPLINARWGTPTGSTYCLWLMKDALLRRLLY